MKEEAKAIISTAREKKGYTQSQVAELIGEKLGQSYSLRQYQRLEAGDFPMHKRKVVEAMDTILGTNICDIVYDKKIHIEGEDENSPTIASLAKAMELSAQARLIDAESRKIEAESRRTESKNIERLIDMLGLKLSGTGLGVPTFPPEGTPGTETLKKNQNHHVK